MLDNAGRENIVIYSVVYCWPRFLHLSIFFIATCIRPRVQMIGYEWWYDVILRWVVILQNMHI